MRILTDGTWLHEGTPITRAAMVRLFSSVLRREANGSHVLVTPVEKLSIAVDDAPFAAWRWSAKAKASAASGLPHPCRRSDHRRAGPSADFEDRGHGERLYLRVRGGLDAMINRAVYYDLANLAIDEAEASDGKIGLWSEGHSSP
jgi:hypothetical protein